MCVEGWSHSVAQTGIQLVEILLPQPLEGWGWGCRNEFPTLDNVTELKLYFLNTYQDLCS